MAIDWDSALKKAKELDEDLEKYAHKSNESERQKIASEQSSKASSTRTKKTASDLASMITQEAKAQAVSRGIELPRTSADLHLASQLQEARSGLSDVKQQQRLLSARNNIAQRSRGYTMEDRDAYEREMRPLRQQAQGYGRDIDRIAYIDKYDTMNREDNFGGQFLASYDMGRIGQDEAMAWHEYLVSPTDENRAYAEAVSRVRENYGARNADTLSEDATLPIISQSLAGYLPQFLDQNIAGLKGAAAGAATGSVLPVAGTAAGAKIGYAAGRALYGYESMQGAAFKALIDEGVDEETARAAANDEALINSLLEGGDAAIDMLTLGIGKGITALLKQPAETAAKTTAQKVASALANYGINVASEGAQEWVQEGVSSANQRRNRTGILNLAAESAGQIGRALSGQDPETLARMNQAGIEGMKVAALMAGADAGGSAILNRRISRNNSINTAQANLSNPEYIQSGIQEAAQNAEHRINQRSITPEQNLLMYNNPLLDSVPTVEEVQSQQAGSPVYQRAMRAELPGGEQQNAASTGETVLDMKIEPSARASVTENPSVQPVNAIDSSTSTVSILPGGQEVNANPRNQGIQIPVENRTWEDASNRKVNAFQYDHPELHPYYSQAAQVLRSELASGTRGERYPLLDQDGYVTGYTGTRRAQASPIEQALDNANLSYNDIDRALTAIIHNQGQENYAAAKKMELVLDDMLSNGYTDADGREVGPNERYVAARDVVNRGIPAESTEYRMSQEEWNSLQRSEPEVIEPFSAELPRAVPLEDTAEIYDIYGSGRENLPENSVGANKASPWGEFVASSKEFFPEGANAARDVDVPTTDPQGRRIRKTAATAMGAKAIPDEAIADIQNMVLRGELSYNRVSDKSSINRAVKTIQNKEYQGALEEFRNSVSKGVVSKDIATLGQQLLVNAANAGDANATAELLSLYAQMETTAGQAVQAASILRKLSPTAQLYAAQKAVDNLNKTIGNKKGRRPSAEDNVPVEIWMQRVGENLADELSRRVNAPKDKAKSVSETILSDLRKFANESAPKRLQTGKKRSNIDRIVDLFQNREAYNEAWQAAKDTISDTFENDPDALAAFDAWLDSSLDYSKMLTKELTGQTEIMISESLVEEFLQQTDQAGRDVVLDKIYQNIADQVPSTWKDKWNAWRYLAMLGNPRTHIRNIAGNVFFQPLRIVKDRTAAAIEAGVSLASGGRLQRTKSFAANPALYKAAWNDWDNVRNVLSGNKYDDIRSEINSRRRIFRAKPLELARAGNSWLLEFEDTIFKRITYADALAGYLQANGVTTEQMRTNTVDASLMARARDYAGQEALRATYQDRNKVSDKVVQVANVLGPAGEAILPFKRTPANILVRGLEYSPAGLAKALTADLIQVKRGNMTGAEAIDHIASGLTGSALFALGAYLFSQGIVTSGGGDDENQDRLNELTGSQNYALNLPGGGNVTLDWLAPEALPFFMGVELMDSMGQSGNTTDSIMTALKSVSDPMLELSMLQSLNDVIDSVSFSENKLGALASSALISYFSQPFPTILGQFERSGEENRMSTYTDKNLMLPTDVQYALGRVSARIPRWDYHQIPYIDAWGREESNGPLVLRAGNNFLNPAYTSSLNVTPVDEEIQRLYTQTGDGGVVPDRPNRYITVNGERVDLSAEQYVQYATERGQMQYDMLDSLIDRSAYQRLTDSEKAAVISDVYQYADAVTKAEISDYQPDSWISKVQSSGVDPANYILYRTSLEDGMTLQDKDKAMTAAGITGNGKARLLIAENPDWADDAKEAGVTQNVFVEYKVLTSGLTGDKDAEGNTISGSKKAKVLAAINRMDIDSETKDALYYAAGYAASGIRDTPWH